MKVNRLQRRAKRQSKKADKMLDKFGKTGDDKYIYKSGIASSKADKARKIDKINKKVSSIADSERSSADGFTPNERRALNKAARAKKKEVRKTTRNWIKKDRASIKNLK